MNKRLILVAVLIAGLGLSARGAEETSAEARCAAYGFPAAPGLVHRCSEHTTGSGVEIAWDEFASAESVEAVVAFYQDKLGDAGMERDGAGAMWRFPVGAKRPERILSVSELDRTRTYPTCDGTALADTRTIVTMSSATYRDRRVSAER